MSSTHIVPSDGAVIYGKTFVRNFDTSPLNGVRFLKCKFRNLTLPEMVNCQFFGCEIDNVDICKIADKFGSDAFLYSISRHKQNMPTLAEVVFHNCSIASCAIGPAIIRDVAFSDCDFFDTKIDSSRFEGSLKIVRPVRFSELKTIGEQSYAEDFVETAVGIQKRLVDVVGWDTIRFLAKLPIPKVGIGVFGMAAVLLPIFNFLAEQIWLKSEQLFISLRSLRPELEFLGERFSDLDMIGQAPQIVLGGKAAYGLLALLALMAISIAHNFFQPKDIGEFTNEIWIRRLRRSRIEYETMRLENRSAALTLTVLYFLVIVVLFLLYAGSAARYIFV